MKELDLSALFCEILGGLAAAAVGVAFLHLLDVVTATEVVNWVGTHSSFVNLALILGGSFLLGLLVDATGLWFDAVVIEQCQWLQKGLKYSDVGPPDGFYTGVSEHVLGHFKEQWTYYSCYRNLLLLLVPGSVATVIILFQDANWKWGLGAGALFLFLGWTLVVSIRELQPLMARILADHEK